MQCRVWYIAWHTLEILCIRHRESYSSFLYLLPLSDFEFYSRSYWATWARTLSCYLPFQTALELCPNMYFVTMILGVSIYLYKSLCLICKLLRQDLSLKTIIQIFLDTIKKVYIIPNQQYVIYIYY